MKKCFLSILIVSVFVLISCNKSKSFTHSFAENRWDFKDSVVFICDIDETKAHNLELFFRNTLDYPYRNLYLLLEIHRDKNILQIDTLQYPITNKYGKFLGRGLGKTRDNYFLEELTIFKTPGKYKFILTHGMRTNPLTGSNAIGIKITLNE